MLTYPSGLSHLGWLINANGTLTVPGGYPVAAVMPVFVIVNLPERRFGHGN